MPDDPKDQEQVIGDATPSTGKTKAPAGGVVQGTGIPQSDRGAADPSAPDVTPPSTGEPGGTPSSTTARSSAPALSELSHVDISSATVVRPATAPVQDKLPAIAKAGVELTKIVLGIIAGFLVLSFISLNIGERVAGNRARDDLRAINIPCSVLTVPRSSGPDSGAAPAGGGADNPGPVATVTLQGRDSPKAGGAPKVAETCTIDAPMLTAVVGHVEKEMSGFRTVWWQFVETVLINMLLPVLTALLGYVFGTRATSQKE